MTAAKREPGLIKREFPYDVYGQVNVVSFIPEDIEVVVRVPDKKKIFDSEIAQSSHEYFQNLKQYTKLLKIRNKIFEKQRA